MRLRLFERLRRLAVGRAGTRARARGGALDSHGRDDGGRHRRDAGASRTSGGGRPSRPSRPAAHSGAPGRHGRVPDNGPPQWTEHSHAAWTGGRGTGGAGDVPWPDGNGVRGGAAAGRPAVGGRAAAGRAVGGAGAGRARIREAPYGAAPVGSVAAGRELPQAHASRAADVADGADVAGAAGVAVPRQPWYQVVGDPVRPGAAAAQPAALPFAEPRSAGHPDHGDGRRNCGALEAVLWRQWDPATVPPSQVVTAIDRLAEFPRQLQEKLADALDGIYVGAGGVPDLDDMSAMHGVPLPAGHATWDACAGAYGERKIVVGSRPSPTPDVMCHEVGHALDDIDSAPGKWQSDSAEFRMLYEHCQPYIASDFHRQRGGLGRKEFFADAFAAIASAQRPALVDMLSGNTRMALRVMLYFNRHYGI
jgi:hypothetical protein